jgi:hypothetical protein
VRSSALLANGQEGPTDQKKGYKIEIGGLFGAIADLRNFKEGGAELIESEIDRDMSPRVPKSYGGVSGGALWELNVELDQYYKTVKVGKRLYGVAFRESEDRKRITSNGVPAIEVIIQKIREKWPGRD